MRSLIVTRPGSPELLDIPMPVMGEYECLVRIRSCGFCNCTDLEIIRGDHVNEPLEFPLALGHEGAGEIVETGKKVRNFSVGDRIVRPEIRFDRGTRYYLRNGNYSEYGLCRDFKAMEEDGVTPQAVSCEAYYPRRIPREISFEDAGVIVHMRENYSAVENIGVGEGTKMLIFGDGPNGFGLCRFSKLRGADFVAVAGHHADRLEHIRERGLADMVIDSSRQDVYEALSNIRLDMVVDAVGRTEILTTASHNVRQGGKVVLYSGVNKKYAKLDVFDWENNVSFLKHFYPYRDLEVTDELCSLILSGVVDPKDWYSHTVPIEDFGRAMELVKSREALKVVVTI